MGTTKKQTAVEWLVEQLIQKQNGKGDSRSIDKIFQQAKEMEKEQIIEAFLDDLTPSKQNIKEAEQYYIETYETN